MIDEMVDIFNPGDQLRPQMRRGLRAGTFSPSAAGHCAVVQPHEYLQPGILPDILEEYPDVFERCARAAVVIERGDTRDGMREERSDFLPCTSEPREELIPERKKAARRVIIGVVCASGFEVARLMLTKLSNRLGDRATFRAYGKDEITPGVIADTDFFVSTLNLDSLGIDYQSGSAR